MLNYGGCSQDAGLPSRPGSIDMQANGIACTAMVPENEVFRVNQIFKENAYSILSRRRHQGPRVIFDVGANIGLFAIYMKCIDRSAGIHCFEPYEVARSLFKANTKPFEEIYLHPYGLYNSNQQATLMLHQFNSGENSIKIEGPLYQSSAAVELKDAGSVFDHLSLDYIDVLKIDTEGCETEILESLGERLKMVDYILVEYHSEKDRRQIDFLLQDFSVFTARADGIDVGTVSYINTRLK